MAVRRNSFFSCFTMQSQRQSFVPPLKKSQIIKKNFANILRLRIREKLTSGKRLRINEVLNQEIKLKNASPMDRTHHLARLAYQITSKRTPKDSRHLTRVLAKRLAYQITSKRTPKESRHLSRVLPKSFVSNKNKNLNKVPGSRHLTRRRRRRSVIDHEHGV